MRRQFHYPPGAFHALREQLVDQTLAQCRCGVGLWWSPPESLAYLLLHPCLVVLPVTCLRALRMAAQVRQQLPGTPLRAAPVLESGEAFALLGQSPRLRDRRRRRPGGRGARAGGALARELRPRILVRVRARTRDLHSGTMFGSITLARDSATVAM